MKAGSCPLCGQRKGKRECPGKGAVICSTCCGTKRHVEVDCPADCRYLTGAHAPSWEGRDDDRRRDLMRIVRHVQELTEDQTALFFYLMAGLVRISARHRDADDAQWEEALAALHKTLDPRESGLIYEHPAEGWRSQALLREMQEAIAPAENEGRPIAPPALLGAAVAALHASVAATRAEKGEPHAFLETAARLTAKMASGEPATPATPARRLIEP
jgi:hypothetical protein